MVENMVQAKNIIMMPKWPLNLNLGLRKRVCLVGGSADCLQQQQCICLSRQWVPIKFLPVYVLASPAHILNSQLPRQVAITCIN